MSHRVHLLSHRVHLLWRDGACMECVKGLENIVSASPLLTSGCLNHCLSLSTLCLFASDSTTAYIRTALPVRIASDEKRLLFLPLRKMRGKFFACLDYTGGGVSPTQPTEHSSQHHPPRWASAINPFARKPASTVPHNTQTHRRQAWLRLCRLPPTFLSEANSIRVDL